MGFFGFFFAALGVGFRVWQSASPASERIEVLGLNTREGSARELRESSERERESQGGIV